MLDIQRRALESWLALEPQPQVIVIGNDPGTKEVCREFDLTHVRKVRKSRTSAPYIDDFIKKAEIVANHDIMLLVSGDIILKQDTISTAEAVSSNFTKYCLCARKMNVKHGGGIIKESHWAHWRAGDYFMHSKGMFETIPQFLMGRCALDNWMFRHAIREDAMIDASGSVTVYHQEHEHKRHDGGRAKEVKANRTLYKNNFFDVPKWQSESWYQEDRLYRADIRHANYVMKDDFSFVDNVSPDRDW